MDDAGSRYGIEELAQAAGVSRRTVRYYVQEGLLPPPTGAGRGAYYGPEHLRQLEIVKALQERGLTLDEVRRALARHGVTGTEEPIPPSAAAAIQRPLLPTPHVPGAWVEPLPPPSRWTRQDVLPGVEIHLAGRYRPLSAWQLSELAEWCRRHLVRVSEGEDPELDER